ncbi:reverse transcriptase domain, reverse transcriptase zinc-binding domain protein [Tanacetum coccineum]
MYPVLNQITVPVLRADQCDKLLWRTHDGLFKEFSPREAWQSIREHGNETEWCHLVWSAYGIAIHLWLVMRKRLKTQDILRQWDVGNDVDLSLLRCPLCKAQPDSHEHLFFECSYSSNVWQMVLKMADIVGISSMWDDILAWLLPRSKSKSVTSIVGRLILAASSYFIWRERNSRIHGKGDQQAEQVSKYIIDAVRLKLASIKFKKNLVGWKGMMRMGKRINSFVCVTQRMET